MEIICIFSFKMYVENFFKSESCIEELSHDCEEIIKGILRVREVWKKDEKH